MLRQQKNFLFAGRLRFRYVKFTLPTGSTICTWSGSFQGAQAQKWIVPEKTLALLPRMEVATWHALRITFKRNPRLCHLLRTHLRHNATTLYEHLYSAVIVAFHPTFQVSLIQVHAETTLLTTKSMRHATGYETDIAYANTMAE